MSRPLVVLAAGRSTRFGSLKQVAPITPGGASVLACTVLDALRAGFDELVMVVRRDVEPVLADHLATHFPRALPPVSWVDQGEPLGTGHAVLLAAEALATGRADPPAAFAVVNGDDLYGAEAMRRAAEAVAQLTATASAPASSAPVHAMLVPYRMADTLSPQGGVSRGWVQGDAGGRVRRVRELREVERAGSVLRGIDTSVEPPADVEVPLDALASMNLWVLPLGVGPLLRRAFERRQAANATGTATATSTSDSAPREFTLSEALDHACVDGELELEATACAGGWMGVTFGPDAEALRRHMATAGMRARYPDPLSLALEDECS